MTMALENILIFLLEVFLVPEKCYIPLVSFNSWISQANKQILKKLL